MDHIALVKNTWVHEWLSSLKHMTKNKRANILDYARASYFVPKDKYKRFLDSYYESVATYGEVVALTECRNPQKFPVFFDFDIVCAPAHVSGPSEMHSAVYGFLSTISRSIQKFFPPDAPPDVFQMAVCTRAPREKRLKSHGDIPAQWHGKDVMSHGYHIIMPNLHVNNTSMCYIHASVMCDLYATHPRRPFGISLWDKIVDNLYINPTQGLRMLHSYNKIACPNHMPDADGVCKKCRNFKAGKALSVFASKPDQRYGFLALMQCVDGEMKNISDRCGWTKRPREILKKCSLQYCTVLDTNLTPGFRIPENVPAPSRAVLQKATRKQRGPTVKDSRQLSIGSEQFKIILKLLKKFEKRIGQPAGPYGDATAISLKISGNYTYIHFRSKNNKWCHIKKEYHTNTPVHFKLSNKTGLVYQTCWQCKKRYPPASGHKYKISEDDMKILGLREEEYPKKRKNVAVPFALPVVSKKRKKKKKVAQPCISCPELTKNTVIDSENGSKCYMCKTCMNAQ